MTEHEQGESMAAQGDHLMRMAWRYVRGLRPETVTNFPAARRAVDAGASAADLATAMSAAAYEAVFELLYVLDEGGDPYSKDDDVEPRWAVVALPDQTPIRGLHEGILSADPTGGEGADLFR